jgi:hypothetical protein
MCNDLHHFWVIKKKLLIFFLIKQDQTNYKALKESVLNVRSSSRSSCLAQPASGWRNSHFVTLFCGCAVTAEVTKFNFLWHSGERMHPRIEVDSRLGCVWPWSPAIFLVIKQATRTLCNLPRWKRFWFVPGDNSVTEGKLLPKVSAWVMPRAETLLAIPGAS